MKTNLGCCIAFLALTLQGCSAVRGSNEITATANPTPIAVDSSSEDDILLLNDIFTPDDTITYGSFTATKQSRKVELDGQKVDVLYAALKKDKNLIEKLDGNVYFGMGNSIDFGLFSFLGSGKQLFVSQLIPRGGAHWVVDVSQDGKVIFDSKKYEVGREDFQVCDINKDGIYEILLPVVSFYGFENYATSDTPLPTIIFKYDKAKREYFPANPEFADFALRDIGEDIKRISAANSPSHLPEIMDVVLNYVYAGKEEDAWQFFDANYQRTDRAEVKRKIIERLKAGAAYKYVYRKI